MAHRCSCVPATASCVHSCTAPRLRPGNVQVFYPEGNVLLPGGHRDRSGVPDYNTTVELVPQ